MGKFWWGKIGKSWVILQKFFSPIFTDTPKMYLAYALTVAYSLPYLYGSPKFSHTQRFTYGLII